MKFLENTDKLEVFFQKRGQGVEIAPFIEVLRSFLNLVKGNFSKAVSSRYKEEIEIFSNAFRRLECGTTVKVHIIEVHIGEFLEMKGNLFGKNCFCFKIYIYISSFYLPF